MKTFDELKDFYKSLSNKYEGYIQMSDEILNKIFSVKQILPSWEDLHKNNFIIEALLFDGERSINIRQINDKYTIIDQNISSYKNISEEFFIAKSLEDNINLKAKIIQVWEDIEDENCLNIKVLKPTLQLFAGFSTGEDK